MSEISKYGYFDDSKREFVVTNPYPPTTWINYLSNGRLCTTMSQTSGGMTFLDNAGTHRFTRYRMSRSVPIDRPGHYVYIRENNGEVWCPAFEPVRTHLDSWKCRQGMGYTIFEGEKNKIKTSLKFFIHPELNVLIWDLKIKNEREEETEVSVFPYVEFSFLDVHEELYAFHWCRMQNTFTYDKNLGAIKYYYGPPYYSFSRTHVFLSSSDMPDTFDCNRDTFIGRKGSEERPESVVAGYLKNNELKGGGHGIGALEFKIKLKQNEEKRLCFYLGGCITLEEVDKIILKMKNLNEVDEAFSKLNSFYEEYLGKMQVEIPDKDMERFINTWNPYNCRHSFERARFVSAVHTGMGGGMQSRDSMQDALSIAHIKPSWARERILTIMKFQHPSGRLIDTFDPNSKDAPDDKGRRCDNGVWAIYTTYAYIAETGDFNILKEKINYYNGEEANLYEHLIVGLKYMVENKGKDGIPLMFGQDWNDSLNLFSEDGAETVMLGEQLIYAMQLFEEISKHENELNDLEWIKQNKKRLKEAINSDDVWDGEWYKRLIFKDSKIALGSKERAEAKIYLNTQSWAVISGAADERGETCMDNARKYLNTPYGLKLLWPPYTGIPEPPHPLVANVPGVSENGGIFNHANTWAIIAESVLKRADRAFEYYKQCLPTQVIETVGIEKYQNEPYCYSSHIITDPDERAGMALLSWLSGTTTWMYIAATQFILGIRPKLEGILIEPCVPDNFKEFKVKRNIRGVLYNIKINNFYNEKKGKINIKIDGVHIDGNIIPYETSKTIVEVEVDLF